MNENRVYDVIIIGAGQCGLSVAYYLEQEDISYLVIEKTRAFSSWYQRWDTFSMNTSNWMNILPGLSTVIIENSYSRSNKHQIINYFENWLSKFSPKIKVDEVKRLELIDKAWIIYTNKTIYNSKTVIMATGLKQSYIPECHDKIAKNINQIHSSDYLSPAQIKTSHILIIGSGSSGVQICEELAKTKLYTITLSCSSNKYFSWSYFGISIHRIVKIFNVFNIRSSSCFGKLIIYFSRASGDPATPPTPNNLESEYKVNLTGKLIDVTGSIAMFENNQSLRLDDITFIWCTGFRVNFDTFFNNKIQAELVDENDKIRFKTDFESQISRLYFIGLRFQRLLSSHIIYGAVKDARVLVSEIRKNLIK